MSDFELYQLSEEHRYLRQVVRKVADNDIAPHAAGVDEQAEFPQRACDALRATRSRYSVELATPETSPWSG